MIGFSHFSENRPDETIKLDIKDNVERVGYVPLKEQVRLYKEAGVLLKQTRALQYDYTDEEGRELSDFEKIDTASRDCKDFADMSALIARSEAQARAVELNTMRQNDFKAFQEALEKSSSSQAGTSELDKGSETK